MSTGTDLATLRSMFKGECGISLTVGTAMDAEINTLLSNRQKWLSAEHDFPQLRFYQDVGMVPGQRYSLVPNLNFQRPLEGVYKKYTNTWDELDYGVGVEEYNYLDSDAGLGQDPIQRWDIVGQFEIPIPTTAPTLAASGIGLTGAFKYAVSFVTPFGETPVGPSASITPTNQGVLLANVPTAANQVVEGAPFTEVTARNIYRTKAGGSAFFLIGKVVGNVVTAYGPDTTADALLVTSAPTSNTAEATVCEIWPIPQTAQPVRFYGQRVLNPLVLDTDTADLDDIMIVLFTAAQYKANRKHADAPLKLQEANARLARVRQTGLKRKQRIILGGGGSDEKARPRLTSVRIGIAS